MWLESPAGRLRNHPPGEVVVKLRSEAERETAFEGSRMARGNQLILRSATFLLVRLRGEQVAEARRAADQLSPSGELETFRNGLLGLLHVLIPTSGAGQDKRRPRAWQGESGPSRLVTDAFPAGPSVLAP